MTSWQKLALVSVSAGAGFALTLLLIAAVVGWLRSNQHPGPWDAAAIEATFDHLGTEADTNDIVFHYALKNTTSLDYRLEKDSDVFLTRSMGETLHPGDVTINYPIYVPAGQRVLVNLQVPDPCFVQVDQAVQNQQAFPKKNETIYAFASYLRQKFTACQSTKDDKLLVALVVRRFTAYEECLNTDELQNLSRPNYPDEEKLEKFVRAQMEKLDGFTLFDKKSRYRINFPMGWSGAKQ